MSTQPVVGGLDDVGFSSGTGTYDNPIVIDEVSVSPPKKSGWSTFWGNLVKGVGNAFSNLTAEKVNDFAKTATKDVGIQTGLDKSTKVFIVILAAVGLGIWYFNRK